MGDEKSFDILIEKRVTKRAKQISEPYQSKIIEKIQSLCENPTPQGSIRLKGNLKGLRFRIGDYRILYTVDYEEKLIVVYLLLHRSEGYPIVMP